MPERPKYDRLSDEEGGIKLDQMRPLHAYVDGDSVVATPPVVPKEEEVVPVTPAAKMPRTPTAPYPLHDDDEYPPPPPALLPGTYSSGRASPVRRDYLPSPGRQQSPGRPSYGDEYNSYGGGGGYTGGGGYNGGGGGYNSGGGYNAGGNRAGYSDRAGYTDRAGYSNGGNYSGYDRGGGYRDHDGHYEV
jgi:hypothetical protein